MSHSLVEISREDWFKLRDLYKQRPREPSGYGLLKTMIQWIERDPTLDLKIYSLDGDWMTDGTFLLLQTDFGRLHIFVNTLNEDTKVVTTALNCLDIKLTYLLFAFSKRLTPAIRDHFSYAGQDTEQFNPDATCWYHIEREKALEFEVIAPKDHKFSRLVEEKHAEQVNSIWPHRSEGSINFVKLLIRFNDSVGLFDKTGNLLAWCLRLPIGSLGLLQVVDSHKRQGLGNLVVRFMAKTIASKNEEVLAPVVKTNKPSRAMFEKLGFSVIDNVYWVLEP